MRPGGTWAEGLSRKFAIDYLESDTGLYCVFGTGLAHEAVGELLTIDPVFRRCRAGERAVMSCSGGGSGGRVRDGAELVLKPERGGL